MDEPGVRDRRAIRVFVSSTFRDMQAERDELVKRVFPQLRRMCEQRGVAWSEVDLRWGVTDEQAAEGAVLPICLAEIERTRPYFIGLLGQRYGWVPDEIPAELAGQLGWLADEAGKRSVTELEILHGVLNDPGQAGHAYFYLREPAWLDTLPAEVRAVLEEPEPAGAERLAVLRQRVRESGYPVADYTSPESLGEAVLADFTALIEAEFPAADVADSAARHDAVHAAFGAARFGLHVDRPELRTALDARAVAWQPLLVAGAPGAGASSLVTDWARRWAADHPDATVLVHHCDADSDAAEARTFIARSIAALDPETEFERLVETVAGADLAHAGDMLLQAARAAATAGRATVLVLDGADVLHDGPPAERAADLRWLLPALAGIDGLTVVVTAAGERARDAFAHRSWPVLDLPELTDAERCAIATEVLGRGAKALDAANLDLLVGAPGTGNASFLTIVLDELRQHGEHFTLRPLIERLTGAATVDDLLELVLARYETDFEGARPGLVGDAMRAIWAARQGLSEAELLDLLAPGPDHLPQRVWAPLHLAAERGLVSRGGLIGFAHADLRRAVEDRYLAAPGSRQRAHAALADYFARQPLGPRTADELAWQQAEAGDLDGLRTTLADLSWAELAYTRHPADLRRLWARAAGSAGLAAVAGELERAYAVVLADPAAHDGAGNGQLVWGVARLLADAGASDAALQLQRYLVESANTDVRQRAALINVGATWLGRGELDRAAAAFTEAAERSRAAGDRELLAAAVGNLALVRRDQRDVAAAEQLFAAADALWRELQADRDRQANLSGWADLARRQNDLQRALALLTEQERVCRELADPVAIGRALAGQAVVLADLGEAGAALARLDEFAGIARAEGDLRGLTEAQLSIALTRTDAGAFEGAGEAAVEAERLARALGDPELLGRVLIARAAAAAAEGEWEAAERLAREAELTARSAASIGVVARALGIAGTARREQGDLAGAARIHGDEATAAEASGDVAAIGTAEANIGNVATAQQRFDVALRHYDAAVAALTRAGTTGALLPVYANRAQIHHAEGRFAQALADYTEAASVAARAGHHTATAQWAEPAIQLAYQLGDMARAEVIWDLLAASARARGDAAGLQRALGESALLVINRSQAPGGDPALLDRAAALLDEQEALCRQLGDPVGLAQCVGNRAIVLRYRGDLPGALACVEEELTLATNSGNAQGVLFAIANRGELLGLLGRVPEALAELGRARAAAAQYGLAPMVQQLDQMIAALQQRN